VLTRRSLLAAATLLLAPGTTTSPSPTPPRQQSPIALRTRDAVRDAHLPALLVDYPRSVDLSVRYVSRDAGDPTGCATRGREETIEAEVPAGTAAISLGGSRYELRQFHFHTASEHTLDGRRFPVEQHFVHAGPDGATLVVGLFLSGGGHGHGVADRVLAELPRECGQEVEVRGADLTRALPEDLSTFRYPGSLTTSPNTEGVSWLVLRRHGRLADHTVEEFRALFPDGDARDLQPLDGRVVRLRVQ